MPQIRLENISLCYRLAKQRIPSLKEYSIHLLRGNLSYEELWALSEVSLSVERGERVGIVGANGAGKSSLLKVISRVLKPTRGEVDVQGVVAPILELGTGFDYELTGLENIHLNALLLGRTNREVRAKLAEIVEFSGLGDLIHSPIRNYSTGMFARLGFSIATAWIPDVVILDEILAVGDAAFQQKCRRRLDRLHDAGTTVLMVSHMPQQIRENCDRALWLEKGRLRGDGPIDEILAAYETAIGVA